MVKENKLGVAKVHSTMGESFIRVFSDIIVKEFGRKISCVAVITWAEHKHPHILVITNSDKETVPEETKKAI
ncbi:unnamed protein product, partial [marine sediment metagenome]